MIKIMAYTAADIPSALAKELDITILPFMIHFGDDSIRADIDLDPEEFYTKLREFGGIPTTSQINPGELEDFYRSMGKENSIIYISISSKASGIHNSACLIAKQLNEEEGFDITVVDSTMFSYPIGCSVVKAAEMARDGKSKEEILAMLDATYSHDTAYFMVDDLAFLKKGGRIKATTMAIGTMLDIKPILNINDGLVEAYKKVRGTKKALATLVDYAVERMDNPAENEVYLLHADAPDKMEILEKMVREKVNPKSIHIFKVGPIITSHAGLGVIGIYFKHKEAYQTYDNN